MPRRHLGNVHPPPDFTHPELGDMMQDLEDWIGEQLLPSQRALAAGSVIRELQAATNRLSKVRGQAVREWRYGSDPPVTMGVLCKVSGLSESAVRKLLAKPSPT